MATFLYRCPNTEKKVQGWIAAEELTEHDNSYVPLECLACRQLHYVLPTTGKVLGAGDSTQ